MQHLIWVYTVCQCPFYGMPGLNGLRICLVTSPQNDVASHQSCHKKMRSHYIIFHEEEELSQKVITVRVHSPRTPPPPSSPYLQFLSPTHPTPKKPTILNYMYMTVLAKHRGHTHAHSTARGLSTKTFFLAL